MVANDKVEGTTVYGTDDKKIGELEGIMIDKISGQVGRNPSQGNGEANPILRAAGEPRRAVQTLYYPGEIANLREDLDWVVAHSKDNIAFQARTLIYATGLADVVPGQGSRVILIWVLAAPQLDRLWPIRCQM